MVNRIDFEIIKKKANALGLEYMGAIPADPDGDKEELYKQWIQKGYHGDMAYLAQHASMKYHPQNILEGAKSLFFVGLNYYQKPQPIVEGEGKVALYAWGRDYHKVLGKALTKLVKELGLEYPGESFRKFTDSGPLDERYYAAKANLGYVGRHTLLISRSLGSYFFIGEILSTIEIETSKPVGDHGSCPSGCFRCIQSCPTGALSKEGVMNSNLCISYLTIEYSGYIDDSLWPLMGSWIFGCDLCQTCCPHNLRARPTEVEDFLTWKAGPSFPLDKLFKMDRDEFLKYGGSPIMRAGLPQLQRNGCIAAVNQKRTDLLPLIEALISSDHVVLGQTAKKACQLLGKLVNN
ncbi:tRNA epoxyqueuosine(34) reductase QueG [Spirochaeta cellobiosiphila]|uniref:tRNA epoxyqueuosine(34) reductase QueG n=1 Tax=Spirochaeta cellobiosiphila TaxID=504483 RepID=UPI00040D01EC|nr:tRNA epoxyqueuosine(34) reductase QueG [Spirochaeta cellobiosiphila]